MDINTVVGQYCIALVFTLLERKTGYDVYVANLSNMLVGVEKYIIAIVPQGSVNASRAYIADLPWVSFQTRQMPRKYTIGKQPLRKGTMPNARIQIQNRTLKSSIYSYPGDDNITVELLHDTKKGTTYQYHSSMSIHAALETYECVITRTLTFGQSELPYTPVV